MILIETLVKNGNSVILGSCNLSLEKRQKVLQKVKEVDPEFQTIIVYTEITEEKLLQNLKEADERSLFKGETPPWTELYEKLQKKEFVEPTKSETDNLIIYNWENIEEVISKIKSILGNLT